MKPVKLTLYIAALYSILTISCENNSGSHPADLTGISGQVVNDPECNEFKSGLEDGVPDTLSCVEYSYSADENKLTLTHFNAGFNCCPGNLYCSVSSSGDTLLIEEFESEALCDCNCLYDLIIETDIPDPGQFFIKFVEPYAQGEEEIFFAVDLDEQSAGSYCVKREHYPWAMYIYDNVIADECGEQIIVDSELYESAPDDEFYFESVTLDGDCLHITVRYGGGCGDTEFKLIDSEVVAESYPVQKFMRLSFKDDDDCEALMTAELSYILTPAQVYGDDKINFHLDGWEETILYSY